MTSIFHIFRGTVDKAVKKKGWDSASLAEFYRQYSDSLNILDSLQGTDAFNRYLQKRTITPDNFAAIEGAAELGKQLKGTSEATQKFITDALITAAQKETNEARDEFNRSFNRLRSYMTQKPPPSPASIASYIQNPIQRAAIVAIENQQKSEIEAINNLFKNPKFVEQLKTDLKITEQDQVNGVRDDMLDAIKKAEGNEFEKFKKTLNESIKTLHNNAQSERDRISYLAALYENDEKMRAMIDEIAAQKGAQGPTTVTMNVDEGKALFKDIKVEDLPLIRTMTGRNLVKEGKDTYSIKFSNLKFLLFDKHNFFGDFIVEKDMASLANTIKACGHTSITMNVDYPKNKEDAEELGRKAFEACVKAGFALKDIHIIVNGKEMSDRYDKDGNRSKGELYNGYSSRENAINKVASLVEKERHERITRVPPLSLPAEQNMKANLQAMRNNAATKSSSPNATQATSKSGLPNP